MRIKIIKGQCITVSDTLSFIPDYKKTEDKLTADVTIEIDHAGLLALIRRAGFNKSKRSVDGPVTVKLSNIRPTGAQI